MRAINGSTTSRASAKLVPLTVLALILAIGPRPALADCAYVNGVPAQVDGYVDVSGMPHYKPVDPNPPPCPRWESVKPFTVDMDVRTVFPDDRGPTRVR